MNRTERLIPLLVLAAGIAAYHDCLHNEFVFDDLPYIVENRAIRSPWLPHEILTYSTRPVIILSFAVNHALGGLDPWGYRLLNVGIHLAAALLLYGVVRRSLETQGPRWQRAAAWAAGIVAMLWVAHPADPERDLRLAALRIPDGNALPADLVLRDPQPCFGACDVVVRRGGDQLCAGDGQQGGDGDRAGRGAALRPGLPGGLLEGGGTPPPRPVRGIGGNLAAPADPDVPRGDANRDLEGDLDRRLREPVSLVVSADTGGRDPALPATGRLAGPALPGLPIRLARRRFRGGGMAGAARRGRAAAAHGLEARGRRQEAMAHFEEALRLRPSYVEAHNSLGLALSARGRIEEAMEHFRHALRIDPGSVEAHNNLGIALDRRGRFQEAIAHYAEALRIDPDSPNVHSNLGIALARSGRREEAIAHFREALRSDPDFEPARESLRTLNAPID